GVLAGDIGQLLRGDIDWWDAWMRVSGKRRRPTHLPLSQEVGQAIVTYLQNGRPRTATDAVFVTCRAPFRPFGSHCAVSVIVDRALSRAGVTRPSRGAAHLLRHSLATSMLREGGSLQDIAAVLRHRSIQACATVCALVPLRHRSREGDNRDDIATIASPAGPAVLRHFAPPSRRGCSCRRHLTSSVDPRWSPNRIRRLRKCLPANSLRIFSSLATDFAARKCRRKRSRP